MTYTCVKCTHYERDTRTVNKLKHRNRSALVAQRPAVGPRRAGLLKRGILKILSRASILRLLLSGLGCWKSSWTRVLGITLVRTTGSLQDQPYARLRWGTRGLEAGLQPEGCRVGECWGVAVFCAARTSLPCRGVKMSQSGT